MRSLTFDQRPEYLRWLYEKLEINGLPAPIVTVTALRDGEIDGVVAYYFFNGIDCHISAAGNKGWLSRHTIPVYFRYPFVQLGCRRVTVLCKDSNKHAQKFVQKLGWKHEGTLRQYYEDGADCEIYGMLKEECQYLGEVDGK